MSLRQESIRFEQYKKRAIRFLYCSLFCEIAEEPDCWSPFIKFCLALASFLVSNKMNSLSKMLQFHQFQL